MIVMFSMQMFVLCRLELEKLGFVCSREVWVNLVWVCMRVFWVSLFFFSRVEEGIWVCLILLMWVSRVFSSFIVLLLRVVWLKVFVFMLLFFCCWCWVLEYGEGVLEYCLVFFFVGYFLWFCLFSLGIVVELVGDCGGVYVQYFGSFGMVQLVGFDFILYLCDYVGLGLFFFFGCEVGFWCLGGEVGEDQGVVVFCWFDRNFLWWDGDRFGFGWFYGCYYF